VDLIDQRHSSAPSVPNKGAPVLIDRRLKGP